MKVFYGKRKENLIPRVFLLCGSFFARYGMPVTGMIFRRHDGSVMFAAYSFLFNCNDALETKIHALLEGQKYIPQKLSHVQNRVADQFALYSHVVLIVALMCGYIEDPLISNNFFASLL